MVVAVPEGVPATPGVLSGGGAPAAAPVGARRFVAVAVDATELLRPESDLVRLVTGARYVDVLLAAERACPSRTAPLGVLAGAVPPPVLGTPAPEEDDEDEDADPALSGDVAALGLPELHVHRLGLAGVTGPQAETDLVAGLSELVGFDPEPGVYLLGPLGGGAARTVLDRAVRRVARVYGIPLLRYRSLELTVVDA